MCFMMSMRLQQHIYILLFFIFSLYFLVNFFFLQFLRFEFYFPDLFSSVLSSFALQSMNSPTNRPSRSSGRRISDRDSKRWRLSAKILKYPVYPGKPEYRTIRRTYDDSKEVIRIRKKLTARFMVCNSGEYVPLNTLPEEKKNRIAAECNDRALRAIGYLPEQEKDVRIV